MGKGTKCSDPQGTVIYYPAEKINSDRSARREFARQQKREQRQRPFARVAKNGFGGDN